MKGAEPGKFLLVVCKLFGSQFFGLSNGIFILKQNTGVLSAPADYWSN